MRWCLSAGYSSQRGLNIEYCVAVQTPEAARASVLQKEPGGHSGCSTVTWMEPVWAGRCGGCRASEGSGLTMQHWGGKAVGVKGKSEGSSSGLDNASGSQCSQPLVLMRHL